MAAIVSKLAAANRKRKANKQYHIPIEKSVYVLPPFDPCFKPEVHNRYIRTKQTQLAHQELMTNIGTVSPVHIEQLERMGSLRLKSKRPLTIAELNQKSNNLIMHSGQLAVLEIIKTAFSASLRVFTKKSLKKTLFRQRTSVYNLGSACKNWEV
jgi:hypothetical protein